MFRNVDTIPASKIHAGLSPDWHIASDNRDFPNRLSRIYCGLRNTLQSRTLVALPQQAAFFIIATTGV